MDMATDKHGSMAKTLKTPEQDAPLSGDTESPSRKAPEKASSGQNGAKTYKKRRKKWILIGVIIVSLALLAVLALKMLGGGGDDAAGLYTTAAVERRDITVALTGSGTLEPAASYTVTALIEGEILSADFEEGDIVEKDTVLYTVDSSDAATSLERAQLAVSQSQKSYEQKLKALEDLTVTAPIAGSVLELSVAAGDAVSAGQTVATVRNSAVMSLTLPFPADDAESFYIGQSAQVTLDGSFETLPGSVANIRGVDEILTGNIIVRQVTIEVKNPGGISPSQYATAAVGDAACTAGGAFAYKGEKAVTASVSGEVSAVYVSEGDAVSQNQALLALESDALENEIENASSSLRDAELSLQNQYDNLDSYTITSPIQGTIIEKSYKAGDTLEGGKTLCTIYDLSYLTMTLYVDELDIGEIAVGQSVAITADAAPDGAYTGTVTKVSIAGTTSGGVTSYPVTIRIDETEGLLPGMNVDAEIVVQAAAGVLAIPVEAVSRGNRVLVLTEDTGAQAEDGAVPEGYAYAEVSLGVSDESYIEVTEGLVEGDVITYIKPTSGSDSDVMMPGMGMPGGMAGGNMPSGNMPDGGGRPGGGMSGGGMSGGGSVGGGSR